MKVLIVYYSMYGHIHRMAEAMAEGARMVKGADVSMRRVPETLTEEVLGKMGALEAQKGLAHVPVCTVDELAAADAIIFGRLRASATCAGRCGSSSMRQAASGPKEPLSARWAAFLRAAPPSTAGRRPRYSLSLNEPSSSGHGSCRPSVLL